MQFGERDEPVVSALPYATMDADGLSDWHAEAESLIDQGQGPDALRRLFPKRNDAARYFAKSMRRRYVPSDAASLCVACGVRPASYRVCVCWTSFLHRRFATAVRFDTHHPMCADCARLWIQGLLRTSRWQRFARYLVWATWTAFVIVPAVLSWAGLYQIWQTVWLIVAGVAILLANLLRSNLRQSVLEQLPGCFSGLRRKGLEFYQLRDLDQLPSTTEAAI